MAGNIKVSFNFNFRGCWVLRWRYANYAGRNDLFDLIIPTIAYYHENNNEVDIDENDLDELSDVTDMSEDEDEVQQRVLKY